MIICRANGVAEAQFEKFDEGIILAIFANDDMPPKVVFPMQMSLELQNKIECVRQKICKITKPEMEKIFAYFRKMYVGEWFYILPEMFLTDLAKYERDKLSGWIQVYMKYKDIGYSEDEINNIMCSIGGMAEKYLTELEHVYSIADFSRKNSKEWMGEPNKEERICRFCGKSMPDTTFKEEAHAIPMALGNRWYFNNYECDQCNHFFGEEIEPHLVQWLGIMTLFSMVRGRNGIPAKRYENGMIRFDEENHRMEIIQTVKDAAQIEALKNSEGIPIIDLGEGEKYIPARVYRALAKIALGFIPEEFMPQFEETVKWVKDVSDTRKLPKIARCLYPQGANQQPELVLYLRKDDTRNDLPAAVVSFMVCGVRLLYIVPFAKNDEKDFTSEDDYNKFWEMFALYSKAPITWQYEDLSQNTPVTPRLKLNFVQRDAHRSDE